MPSLLITTAAKPPVDITPAIIIAALATHPGHITALLSRHPRPRSVRLGSVRPCSHRLTCFRPLPDALMDMLPAPRYSLSVVF